jgi:ABC-type Fe3+/spermidine/putrescine transport system ATPase subunit
MIRIRGLRFRYGGQTVFDGLSLDIPGNAVLAAPSGAGKTTLLKLVAGLLTPESGSVSGVPGRVSFLFQEDRLLPWYTVAKNLELVCGRTTAGDMLARVGIAIRPAPFQPPCPAENGGELLWRGRCARKRSFSFWTSPSGAWTASGTGHGVAHPRKGDPWLARSTPGKRWSCWAEQCSACDRCAPAAGLPTPPGGSGRRPINKIFPNRIPDCRPIR